MQGNNASISTTLTKSNKFILDSGTDTGVSISSDVAGIENPLPVGNRDVSLGGIVENAPRLKATHVAKLRGKDGANLGTTLVFPGATQNLASLVGALKENPGAYFDGDIDNFNIYYSKRN